MLYTNLSAQVPCRTACQIHPSDYHRYLRFKVLNVVRLQESPPHFLRFSFSQLRSIVDGCRRAVAPEWSNEGDGLWGDLRLPVGAAGTQRGAERDYTISVNL